MQIYLGTTKVEVIRSKKMVEDKEAGVIRMTTNLRQILDTKINSKININTIEYVVKQKRLSDANGKEESGVNYIYVSDTSKFLPVNKISFPNIIIKRGLPEIDFQGKWTSYSVGSDPELMISDKQGNALTADRFLQERATFGKSQSPRLYADGFVAELAPPPSTCRALHMGEVYNCLSQLSNILTKKGEGLMLNAKSCFKVDRKELEAAGERARIFGCDPSTNAQDDVKSSITLIDPRKIDGMKHKKRYAGGHLHLGLTNYQYLKRNELHDNYKIITKLSDLLVGIPSVMLDRDKVSKERRMLYGRAGEFRLPPHGYEYRVPSNFWLRTPGLGSLLLGSLKVAARMLQMKEVVDYILTTTDWDLVVEAINDNSFSKATKVWLNYVRPLLMNTKNAMSYNWDLTPIMVPLFEFVVQKGIDRLWPGANLIENWHNAVNSCRSIGGGHTVPGWQFVMFAKFCEQGRGNDPVLFREYIDFRKKSRKKGLLVPGPDDWSLTTPLCRG